MPLTSEEIAAAEKMHESVRVYGRNRRQTILFNCLTIPLVLTSSFLEIGSGHTALGYSMLGFVLGLAFAISLILSGQQKRHQRDSVLLQLLEREYGDQLSWVEVEKHLAEMNELEQELANHHVTP